MRIEIKILNKEFYHVQKLGGWYYDTPDYATTGSAAVDFVCTEDFELWPGETKAIHTGLAIWLGASKEPIAGLIIPRSGLGTKGLVLANTIGLIDEDYQGELIVQAWNRNAPNPMSNWENRIQLKAGDRIAQLMFVPTIRAVWNVVEEFSNKTSRGMGGFGSTGE